MPDNSHWTVCVQFDSVVCRTENAWIQTRTDRVATSHSAGTARQSLGRDGTQSSDLWICLQKGEETAKKSLSAGLLDATFAGNKPNVLPAIAAFKK